MKVQFEELIAFKSALEDGLRLLKSLESFVDEIELDCDEELDFFGKR